MWDLLPAELLEKVFYYLSNHSVIHCQLTCKQWAKIAQPHLYKEVTLSTLNIEKFKRTILSSTNNNTIGMLVKKINLINEDNALFDPLRYGEYFNVIPTLSVQCPHVESLNVSKTSFSFWLDLNNARDNNYWPRLKEIPYPMEVDGIYYYTKMVLGLRGSIKNILLCDQLNYVENAIIIDDNRQHSHSSLYRSEYVLLKRELSSFLHLTKLIIRVHTNESIQDFDSVFEDCPLLKNLSVTLYYFDPAKHVEGEEEAGNDEEEEPCLTDIVPRPNVAILDFISTIHSSKDYLYIMYKFPSLRRLYINFGCDERTTRLVKRSRPMLSKQLIKNLLNYIIKIEDCRLDNIYTSNFTETVYHLMTTAGENVIYSPLEIIYENDNLNEIHHEDAAYLRLCTIKKELDNKTLPFQELNTTNKQKKSVHFTIVFKADTDEFALPHVNLLNEIGHTTSLIRLELDMKQKRACRFMADNTDFINMISGYYLDHLFRTCISLKYLVLRGAFLLDCDPNTDISQSIEHLILSHCRIHPPVLYQLSIRLPLLKTITLDCWEFVTVDGRNSTEYIEQFLMVDMPYTSLNTIRWISDDKKKSMGNVFYLRICTMIKEVYYRGDRSELHTTSAQAYRQSMSRETTMTFCIRCKDIKVFSLYHKGFHMDYQLVSQ
ncbi:MAG: hypothetical protein EXX96DRAFT_551486 [Benjaminiella poitrasii]|nr:MAG: hypothetical protein EXX96DRAFT_551486 [Benjaminiella poitrasii]